MKTKTIAGHLKRSRLFKHFDSGELGKLALMVEVRTLNPGQKIYDEGELGEGMYIIAQGEVILSMQIDDEAREISHLAPVSSFGEMGVLSPSKRLLSARAVEEVVLLELTFGTLRMLETSDPQLALRVLAQLRLRLSEVIGRCDGMIKNLFKELLAVTDAAA